jgi:hypothetical protein
MKNNNSQPEDWEERFREYVKQNHTGKMYLDMPVIMSFIRQELSTQQKAHEAEMKEQRTQIRKEFNDWFMHGTELIEDAIDRILS